jgi:hypothetical protein
MKLPIDKDPTIPLNTDKKNTKPRTSYLNKNNHSKQSVEDSPNAFKGETHNQEEQLIQADSLITQNHNKIGKIISSYILSS